MAFANEGMHERYERTKEAYLNSELNTLAEFADRMEKNHDLLAQMGQLDTGKGYFNRTRRPNPHKDVKCPWCHRKGHTEDQCYAKRDGLSREDARAKTKESLEKQGERKKKQRGRSQRKRNDDEANVAATVTFSAFIGRAAQPVVANDDTSFKASVQNPNGPIHIGDISRNIASIHARIRAMGRYVLKHESEFHLGVADSGTNLHLVDDAHPFRDTLTTVKPAKGSVSGIGDHKVKYTGVGHRAGHRYTLAKNLNCLLWSAIQGGHSGITTVCDWNSETGENVSFVFDKNTGTSYPLVQKEKNGLLYIPLPKTPDSASAFLSIAETCQQGVAETVATGAAEQGVIQPGGKKTYAAAVTSNPPATLQLPTIPESVFPPTSDFYAYSVDDAVIPCDCPVHGRGLYNALLNAAAFLATKPASHLARDILPKLTKADQMYVQHCRMSHLSLQGIKELFVAGVGGIIYHPSVKNLCIPCLESRQTLAPTPTRAEHSTRNPTADYGTDVHADVVYATHPDLHGNQYHLTVVDEKTTGPIVALSRTRGPLSDALIHILDAMEAKSGRKLKSLQIDRGGELFNKKVTDYVVRKTGSKPRVSLTEKPWQNGLAERMQGVLWNSARALLKLADLPHKFWGYAVLHAAAVMWYRPCKRLKGLCPKHYIDGKAPSVKMLRVFGCPVQVHVPARRRDNKKLDDRSVSGIHLGLSDNSKGWKIYVPATKPNDVYYHGKRTYTVNPDTNTLQSTEKFGIIDSDDVKFNETFQDLRGRQMKIYHKGRTIDFPKDKMSLDFLAPTPKSKRPSNVPHIRAKTPPKISDFKDDPRHVHADGTVQPETISWLEQHDNPFSVLSMPPPAPAPAATPIPGPGGALIPTPAPPAPVPAPVPAPAPPLNQVDPVAAPAPQLAHVEPVHAPVRQSSRRRRSKARFNPDSSNEQLNEETKQYLASLASAEKHGHMVADAAFFAQGLPQPVVLEMATETAFFADKPNPDKLHELEPQRRAACEDAIKLEEATMLEKCVDEVPISKVPKGEKIHRSILMLTEKTKELPDGTEVPDRTRARCCFFGAKNAFDPSNVERTYAPCVRWMSCLIVACFIGMLGFCFTGIDYSAAYLNATLTTPVYMWPPKPMRKVDAN